MEAEEPPTFLLQLWSAAPFILIAFLDGGSGASLSFSHPHSFLFVEFNTDLVCKAVD